MAAKQCRKMKEWWSEEYGFFGDFYMNGDNSQKGYLIEKEQTLQDRTITEVNGVINLLNIRNGSKILDCPCGYGRHAIELLKRGHKVLGSDLNSVHLKKAVEMAKKQGVEFKYKRQNMINLPFYNEFDIVINMFYSFGFFESDKDNYKVLKRFYHSLKNKGKLLIHTDVNVPRIINGRYKTDEKRNLISGNSLRIIDNYDPATRRINGKWIINNGNKITEKLYSIRVYTKSEFENLCLRVGFKKVAVYSDWNGTEYHEDSEDMMVVAFK